VNAVEDGSSLGFSLVWLNDKDGNLWMCDADDGGKVYSYAMVTGDLLDGDGPDMIGLQLASDGTFDGMTAGYRGEGLRRLSDRRRQGAGKGLRWT
jgi:hypothetical protein